jgi:hypothetical protein
MPTFDFAQVLGLLSFVLGIACFYQKDDARLKFFMSLMLVNHTVHFYLLDALVASLTSLFGLIRTIVSIRSSSPMIALTFIIASILMGIYMYETWIDVLPILGGCIGTYALFCMQGIAMRLAFTCGGICWLVNNILVGSIGTTLLEATLLVVNLTTIYRLYTDSKS